MEEFNLLNPFEFICSLLKYHNYVNNKLDAVTLDIIECALINVSRSVTFPLPIAVGAVIIRSDRNCQIILL